MDIYQMKYENIADRLKRLATSPQPLSNPNPNLTPQSSSNNPLSYRRPDLSTNQNISNGSQGRSRYQQLMKYTKNTMQTDQSTDQQPDLPTKRNFLKEKMSPPPREKRNYFPTSTEFAYNIDKQREERTTMRRELTEDPKEEEKANLTKVKSQSTLKMEEIMESFNNYKLNKEKLVSSIGRSHNRTGTEPLRRYTQEAKIDDSFVVPQDIKKIFGDIDNIWNEGVKNQEKAPQFQRSRKVKCGLNELTDILNETIEFQDNLSTENRPRDFSRGRIVFKGNSKPEQVSQCNKLEARAILSPRGMRAPGKICKNSNRENATRT